MLSVHASDGHREAPFFFKLVGILQPNISLGDRQVLLVQSLPNGATNLGYNILNRGNSDVKVGGQSRVRASMSQKS